MCNQEWHGEEKIAKQFERVSISHETIARLIENIDNFLVDKISDIIKNSTYFSIALDESTDISNTSQLLIFIRALDQDFNVSEELLKLASLHETTKGIDIFNEVNNLISIHVGF